MQCAQCATETGGRRTYCCKRCQSRAYYLRHREERLTYQNTYNASHKEESCSYYALHREGRLAYQNAYNASRAVEQAAAQRARCRSAKGKVAKAIRRGHIQLADRKKALERLVGTGFDGNGNVGRCELCGEPPGTRGLYADHDHETGRWRGWLCKDCNLLEGRIRNNMSKVALVLSYITTGGPS